MKKHEKFNSGKIICSGQTKQSFTKLFSQESGAFTLVELLVTITIITLISVVSFTGFFDFLDNKEANAKMTEFESKVKELDTKVKNREISDYKLEFYDNGSFIVYENIVELGDDYVRLNEVGNYTGSLVFENGKLRLFDGNFREEADYRVSVFNGSTKLNNIELIRLDKKNKDFKFLNNVSIENIGGRKNVGDGEVRFIYKDKEYSLKLK